ncbi:MAG: histidine--tRNA ligase [Candidatus Acidiferrales bacterium]
MSEKKQFRAIKGTRDILPPDSSLWNWFEKTAREVFKSYNFREIRLPVLEETSLFARSIGADTDVVSKEMYTFEDYEIPDAGRLRSALVLRRLFYDDFSSIRWYQRQIKEFLAALREGMTTGQVPNTPENARLGQEIEAFVEDIPWPPKSLGQAEEKEFVARFDLQIDQIRQRLNAIRLGDVVSLRPEATASVTRAYLEHGMHVLPGNQKLYYIGPMFRRERPQKGRYRQFYQIGAEVLGQSDAPAIDAEVLEMLLVFFKRVGLTRTTLYLNSIGDKNCRPQYVELLREELRKVKDQLGPDSQRRIETNPLRVLDSKLPQEQEIIAKLPRISDHLCADCREHFAKLKDELKLRDITYEENWRLVRGLDYYTRTTFEVTTEGLGSQNAVCGGGRYDGLVELLGGPPTKGIGFAIGSDRAILSIQESGKLPQLPGLDVFVAWMDPSTYPAAVAIAKKLRGENLSVELPAEEMKFKKSLNLADKLGARYALIIGSDEVASGTFTLKRLADGDQKKLSEYDLLEYLESEKRGTRG